MTSYSITEAGRQAAIQFMGNMALENPKLLIRILTLLLRLRGLSDAELLTEAADLHMEVRK